MTKSRGIYGKAKGMTCTIKDCELPVVAKSLCNGHYKQVKANKMIAPVTTRLTVRERICKYSEIDENTGCWVWIAQTVRGYPRLNATEYNSQLAHRASYIAFNGEIETGTVVHHKCGNNRCVNPEHLQAVEPINNYAEMYERTSLLARIAELEAELSKHKTLASRETPLTVTGTQTLVEG